LFHAFERRALDSPKRKEVQRVDILWILLIVILVLALLGFFSRGYW
jgi:flagellar basal body-associated protein FliL